MSLNNSNINNSNKNLNNINTINIDTSNINNNDDKNKTPLKNVYSNMTSSNQSRKLSSLEEKLSSINTPANIENYYQSLKTENQGVIPQVKRMELLQKKMNLLQNTSSQNSKALQKILEVEMNERLRYPKYTIIQNTPLTPHEEIVNEILKKKFGPAGVYSMNYPTVVFKNQEEINELQKKQNNNINNNNNNNTVGNKVTFQSNENRPITVKMLKEIQTEILNLRKTLSELKIGFKEMKEQIKLNESEEKHKNTLMIEKMRKIIENGGDTKLKTSMEQVLDRKKIDINEVKTDLETFKGEELINIIKNEINIYDEKKDKVLIKQFEVIKKFIKENQNQNVENKIEGFEDFIKLEQKSKKESQTKKSSQKKENETNEDEEKSDDEEENETSKSKSTKKKKDKKQKSSSEEEEEDEEEEEEESDDDSETTNKKKSKTNTTKKKNKNKKDSSEEEEEEEEESESKTNSNIKNKKIKQNKSVKSKTKKSGTNEDEENESKYTDNVSEIKTNSKSKSKNRTSNIKGNKNKSNKTNKKKSETITERESEDNDDSDEEESKSKSIGIKKKVKKYNTKSNNQKSSANKNSSSENT